MSIHIKSGSAGRAPQGLRRLYCVQSTGVFAEVAVDIPSRDVCDRLFTYRIPPEMQNDVFVGSQVLVPFGHQDMVPAYVVAIREEVRLTNDRPTPAASIKKAKTESAPVQVVRPAVTQLTLSAHYLQVDATAQETGAQAEPPQSGLDTTVESRSEKAVRIRDVGDIVESEPLFDRDYIDFLYWIADYYCCSITQVVAAPYLLTWERELVGWHV